MTVEAARYQIKMNVVSAGIISTDMKITAYFYRKHALTAQANMYGLDIALVLAGHRPGSDAILQNYFQGSTAVDIAAALVAERKWRKGFSIHWP